MPNISYDILLNKNLKQQPLYLKQIEAIIDIKGAEVDPLTLQQIRDEPSLNDCFKARRKNINDLYEKVSKGLKKEKSKTAQEKLLAAFNAKLKSEVSALEKQLQERANKFVTKQKKDVNDLFWAKAKLVCRVAWSIGKLISSIPEAGAKVAAAAASGGFFTVAAIKGVITAVSDMKGALEEVSAALESERSQFDRLNKAVKALKNIKKPKPVPQSQIDEVRDMLGPYGARLLGLDAAAKKAATKLNNVLKQMDKGKFRNGKPAEAAEELVDSTIKQIIELSKNVAQGRKLLQSAKTKLADVSKRAKDDSSYFWTVVGAVWKVTDAVIDMHESNLSDKVCRDFKSYSKQAFEKLKDVLKDELADAVADKVTT